MICRELSSPERRKAGQPTVPNNGGNAVYSLLHLVAARLVAGAEGNQPEKPMNKVLFISLRGELQVFESDDLNACILEANRLNTEHGYTGGVRVVEREDGYRITAAECKAAA